MINITPERFRRMYQLYPDRADIELDVREKIIKVLDLLQSFGRAPIDLGA